MVNIDHIHISYVATRLKMVLAKLLIIKGEYTFVLAICDSIVHIHSTVLS